MLTRQCKLNSQIACAPGAKSCYTIQVWLAPRSALTAAFPRSSQRCKSYRPRVRRCAMSVPPTGFAHNRSAAPAPCRRRTYPVAGPTPATHKASHALYRQTAYRAHLDGGAVAPRHHIWRHRRLVVQQKGTGERAASVGPDAVHHDRPGLHAGVLLHDLQLLLPARLR